MDNKMFITLVIWVCAFKKRVTKKGDDSGLLLINYILILFSSTILMFVHRILCFHDRNILQNKTFHLQNHANKSIIIPENARDSILHLEVTCQKAIYIKLTLSPFCCAFSSEFLRNSSISCSS